ncbi:MAG TPA: M48 family metallopeptidase [Syntrophorhabdaceae bacterium]|nr:M48 family metallopeptidase [Syntrophorhabdaceae bacterium]
MLTINDFKKEVFKWANEIGVTPKEVHLKKMTRKWASCSSKGRLTFSYELLTKSKEIRARVIVHELLHLKYPSHNKLFHALLSAYLAKKGMLKDSILV